MSRITELRKTIASGYCRNILWVDDEIRPGEIDEGLSRRYREFFLPIAAEIHAKGLLMQLQAFPQTSEQEEFADNEAITTVKRLVVLADAIILDWHLGAEDPRNSSQILRHIVAEGGSRFVIILTNFADRLPAEFSKAVGDVFDKEVGGYRHSGNGQFVAFLGKPANGSPEEASRVLKALHDMMMTVYPDYVHWAALEIAANIKKYTPQWLSGLPQGMDLALLSEYCHKSKEVKETVVENLFEDLIEASRSHEIGSLHDDNCKPEYWSGKSELEKITNDLAEGDLLKVLCLDGSLNLSQQVVRDLKASRHPEIEKYIKSHYQYIEFCEVVSYTPGGSSSIRPGAVFRKTSKPKEIYVCASQACDCLWGNTVLLIRGKKDSDPKSGSTLLNFGNKIYRFDAVPKNIESVDITGAGGSREMPGYEYVGMLRGPLARRLISRFWTYATRPAVNMPIFARKEREGE